MSKIQNRLDSLQPYVIGLRFQNGMPIVDAVFQDGWHVPQSEQVQSNRSEDSEVNYHMFYSQDENIGLDEILDYIEKIMGLNIEREKKHELLKVKAKELQEIFRKNPLSKLKDMKFILGGEKLIPKMEDDEEDVVDIDFKIETPIIKPKPTPNPQPEAVKRPEPEAVIKETVGVPRNGIPINEDPNVRRAPNGEIIPPLSPEDTGEIEDEFKKYELPSQDPPITKQVGSQKIDLPPKKKKPAIELAEIEGPQNVICKCDPEEVCPICEEQKIGSY